LKLDTIYKKTSTGKTQEWTIEIEGNRYRTISGQTYGKKVVSSWTTCSGKNIGKSNETTPDEQAMREAEALRRKRLEKDYREDIEESKINVFKSPMLAKSVDDYWDKLVYPLYEQPKLDGIRGRVEYDSLWSRNGKQFFSCPHIIEACEKVVKSYGVPLDGELYNHEFKEDFNEISSIVKKQKPTKEDFAKSRQFMQFWCYDVMADGKFSERSIVREKMIREISKKYPGIVVFVKHRIVYNRAELDAAYEQEIIDGFEGQMLRFDSAYEYKRTKYLLKHKEFQDDEFPIIDIVEGVGNRSGMAGYIVTHTKLEQMFKSNIKGNRTFLRELLINKNQYIGKSCTINYFRLTPDGIPRFPRVTKIAREDYE
jgi:DNA ligase-1